ncbi:urease accessory protein UreF [Marinicrinis lubricantis]|uniref:Urease accessory protein UreF n=1 Tax=Marinicrinis lubricantis TaxID=2086470 RepID=A0ABW1ILK1_9BACL
MKKESKFLYYVQLLDSALPAGTFSFTFGLNEFIKGRRISEEDELIRSIDAWIRSSLFFTEGLVVKGMLEALNDSDMKRFYRYGEWIYLQRMSFHSDEPEHQMGKKYIKLAKTIYPWMDLKEMEQFTRMYSAGTLPAVHAFTAHRLGISSNQAMRSYLYTLAHMMVNSALRQIPVMLAEENKIMSKLMPSILETMEKAETRKPEQLFSSAQVQRYAAETMNHQAYTRLLS